MGIKLSSVATVTARNTNYNGQVRLEKANTARHCLTKSCSQFCMCCSTARHCWTLFSHIIHARMNTQICNLVQCIVFNDVEDPTIATLMFIVLHVLLNSSSREYTEHPWKVYASILGVSCPPLLGWCSQCYSHITYTHINTQYASFCNAPLSRMQSTSLRSVWYI